MNHLAAYYQLFNPDGVLVNVDAVQDTSVFTSGKDIRVPLPLPTIIGEVAMTGAANLIGSQVQSPSLRTIANIDVEPVVDSILFGDPPEAMMHPMNPIPVTGDEAVNFAINSDDGGNRSHYGFIWFADGAQATVNGEIYSITATANATLVHGVWVNSNLTFNQVLPVGNYQVVGMRARGTNLVAARLVFVGGTWRPGVPAVNSIADLDAKHFRYGRMGVLGEFHTNTPPTLDCIGATDTAQTITLDVIRVG